MTERILASFERLLHFRLLAQPPADEEELRELLDDWYRLRRACEDAAGDDPPPAADGGAPAGQAAPAESRAADGLFGPKAVFKRQVLERLAAAREGGFSLSRIEKAGGGAFSLADLTAMARCEKVPFALWKALSDALDRLAAERDQETDRRA